MDKRTRVLNAMNKMEVEPDDYVCPLCGVDKSHFTKE